MKSKGPSTERERQTLVMLRDALPEYEINPHMRLANVVKGRIKTTRNMGQYEIDFVVCDPISGNVICAIELDDSTHNTSDGQRRDANKNTWLRDARIQLIRIQQPHEASNIRYLIKKCSEAEKDNPSQPQAGFYYKTKPIYTKSIITTNKKRFKKYITSLVAIVAIAGLMMWTLNSGAQKILSISGKNAVTQQQRMQQENQQWANQQKTAQQNAQAEAVRHKQQEIEQTEAQQRKAAQQPRYERMLIKGKHARECKNEKGELDNNTAKCMIDHYEMVLVNGPQ